MLRFNTSTTAAQEVPGAPSTGSSCTASLIAPRLAVLAAHCVGNTPAGLGGDLACSPRDANGGVIGSGGCGHVTATDANGIVLDAVDISDLYVTIPTPSFNPSSDLAHDDVAIAVLPRPFLPNGRPLTPIPPLLDAPLDDSFWKDRAADAYGWGGRWQRHQRHQLLSGAERWAAK